MTKKFLSILSLTLIFALMIFSNSASAQSKSELTNITAYDLDENTLRIEIDCKGKISGEDIAARTSWKSLLIDIDNTMPGRVNRIAGKNISAKDEIDRITVKEFEKDRTRVQIFLKIPVSEDSYTVSFEPAVRSEKKPPRIVIDVKKSATKEEKFDINDKVVVLDAGHGGSDTGAVGPHRVTEKSVTLAVALKTEKLLKDAGAKVVMTRRTDIDVASPSASNVEELQARVNKTPPQADIFISIHCNAFSNSNAHGMETYYYGGSPRGKYLAQLLNEELEKFGGLHNRGVKSANFYVLKHTKVPASLVELAFVTNYDEERLLSDDSYQEKLARAITAAVNRFFNGQ